MTDTGLFMLVPHARVAGRERQGWQVTHGDRRTLGRIHGRYATLMHRPNSEGTELMDTQSLALTAQVVAGYVAGNKIAANDLPELIATVHRCLHAAAAAAAPPAVPDPAVPIRKSVMPDYIVCLEDGKKLKILKRHIMRVYNLTPEQYRKRWGLPPDYPMTAPNYAKVRSRLAKKMGLGRR